MRTWTEREIAEAFKPIWTEWLNKEGPSAAIKAFGLKLKEGIPLSQIKLACNIYSMEHAAEDPKYTHKLSNFLNHDHWKDTVEATANPEAYRRRLEDKQNAADEVAKAWTELRKPHWAQVVDLRSARGVALVSLRDQFFESNWKKALDNLTKIFQYKRRESEPHSKLILTFNWFCVTSPTKHTVARILEGYYGHPVEESTSKKYTYSEEEEKQSKDELISWMKEMGFGRYGNERPITDSEQGSSEDKPPTGG